MRKLGEVQAGLLRPRLQLLDHREPGHVPNEGIDILDRAPDAIQLALGISEALINTAGGLAAAIMGIVAYNYFVNKVDMFTYAIDEVSQEVVAILTGRA